MVFGGVRVENGMRSVSADVFEIDIHSLIRSDSDCQWQKRTTTGTPDKPQQQPRARYAHTAVQYQQHMIVFGGNATASAIAAGAVGAIDADCVCALGDVWLLDVRVGVWREPKTSGSPAPPRFGHSATVVGDHMILFGGWHNALQQSQTQQQQLQDQNQLQSLQLLSEGKVCLLSDLWTLHLQSFVWIRVRTGPVVAIVVVSVVVFAKAVVLLLLLLLMV